MANNVYRQPYRQGPPPGQQQQQPHQQGYYDDRYDSRGYNDERHDNRRHNNERYDTNGYHDEQQNQMYNWRHRNSDGYPDQNYNEQYYPHDDNHYDRDDSWGNNQHYEPDYREPYSQQPPRRNPESRQQRPYQYDERYEMNGPNRIPDESFRDPPPQRSPIGRPPPDARSPLNAGPPPGTRPPLSARPPPSAQRGDVQWHDNGYRGNQPGNTYSRPLRVQERILPTSPESPKTPAWDNPFPTFPSKKKQAECKKDDAEGTKQATSLVSQRPLDVARPSTSHKNRHQGPPPPDLDVPRPHTSHSQRDLRPLQALSHPPPVPRSPGILHTKSRPDFHQDPLHSAHDFRPNPRFQSDFHQESFDNDTSSRPPGPRRAMTGLDPGQTHVEYDYQAHDFTDMSTPGDHNEYHVDFPPNQNDYRNYQPHERPESHGYEDPSNNRNDQHFQDPQTLHQPHAMSARPGTDPNSRYRQPTDEYHVQEQAIESYNNAMYRYNSTLHGKRTSSIEADINIDSRGFQEKVEDHQGGPGPQPDLAYRKPTYQTNSLPELDTQQHTPLETGESLASPLAQFAFELDSGELPPRPPKTPISTEPAPRQHDSNQYQNHRGRPPSGADSTDQYGQRPNSQTQTQRYHSHGPSNFPTRKPAPIRPGLTQAPPNTRQSGGESRDDIYNRNSHEEANYGSGYRQNGGYHRGPPLPSSGVHQSNPPREGYDQRSQLRANFDPSQIPPRSLTSNSVRPGPNPGYAPRNSAESFRTNAMQNPDSLPSHPAPYRPGLAQPAPPMPRSMPPRQQPSAQLLQPQPQTHQRIPSAQRSESPTEPPVTVAELNDLRNDFKNRPNDYALGLKFAKRLVEAAKVLASENGKADSKQTAKNRERYILDAHKIVKRLCSAGYSEAMFYLADCYGQGLLGLQTDPKEAFSLYQSAAKLGHAAAAYRVAVCCELGTEDGGGTRRDPLKAVQWYKRAATLGDAPAMYKMGMIQLKGLLGQQKSPREAISWLKRAAERADAENPHALHELGLLYESALSTDVIVKDEPYALQLFQQAADLGYKYSQFRLGSAYEYGLLGLPIDPRMSIAWYSRAAKQSEHQSEFALSGWYLTGSGQSSLGEQPLLPQSDTEAYLWARKAASSGLAKAEYAMGYYTEVGIGVTSNIEEAKRWYYRAAAQNHPKARERLEDLKKGGKKMQKTQVSRSNVGKHNEGECAVM